MIKNKDKPTKEKKDKPHKAEKPAAVIIPLNPEETKLYDDTQIKMDLLNKQNNTIEKEIAEIKLLI